MPTGQGEDEIEEDTVPAAAVTGAAAGPGRNAAAGPGRRFKPAAPPRDLQAALAPLEDDEYCISPHQVILDADIDHLSHPEAGPALMSRASQFLPEPFSDADE